MSPTPCSSGSIVNFNYFFISVSLSRVSHSIDISTLSIKNIKKLCTLFQQLKLQIFYILKVKRKILKIKISVLWCYVCIY